MSANNVVNVLEKHNKFFLLKLTPSHSFFKYMHDLVFVNSVYSLFLFVLFVLWVCSI